MDGSDGTSWTELSISLTIRGLIAWSTNTLAGTCTQVHREDKLHLATLTLLLLSHIDRMQTFCEVTDELENSLSASLMRFFFRTSALFCVLPLKSGGDVYKSWTVNDE